MTSLYLPAPKRSVVPTTKPTPASSSSTPSSSSHATNFQLATLTKAASNQQQLGKSLPSRAPSYEQRCQAAIEFSKASPTERKTKKLFVPRSIADFDDGGSFPEIHVAQYPKHMGNPHLNKRRYGNATGTTGGTGGIGTSSNSDTKKNSLSSSIGSSISTTQAIVNVEIDANGNKDYTSLIKSGTNSNKKVYAKHSDLKGYNPSKEELSLPTHTEEQQTANKTQDVINALLANKVALSKPSGTAIENASTSMNQEDKTQFISYTPNPNAPGYNAEAAPKRIIQMVPAQLDPMMPPKHKHEKAPPGPADDFTPVLHAPPEKLTKEERDSWNIPACISNWKNTRGYTIPLDKRLAADGRGLRDDTTINSNFATLSESLYLAERNAREEVRMRALVKKRQVETERDRREKELRELAMKAREERGSGGVATSSATSNNAPDDDISQRADDDTEQYDTKHDKGVKQPSINDENSDEDYDADSKPNIIPEDTSTVNDEVQQRERIRQERRRERVRELRLERKGKRTNDEDDDDDVTIKKARLGDRDISEKIALGVHTGAGGDRGGVDGRLYNQSAGLDSGFGADDEYNTYTKPMFDREGGVTSSSIYRPSRGEDAMDADEQYNKLKSGATSRFQPDRGFKGAEGGDGMSSAGPRNAPVQFEKAS